MSDKRNTAPTSAAKLAAGAVNVNGSAIEATPAEAARDDGEDVTLECMAMELARKCEADGMSWNEANTEPAAKTFAVQITLTACERLMLGLLARRAGESPLLWLTGLLRDRFDDLCSMVFWNEAAVVDDGGYDDELHGAYVQLAASLKHCIKPDARPARLMFKPSVMA